MNKLLITGFIIVIITNYKTFSSSGTESSTNNNVNIYEKYNRTNKIFKKMNKPIVSNSYKKYYSIKLTQEDDKVLTYFKKWFSIVLKERYDELFERFQSKISDEKIVQYYFAKLKQLLFQERKNILNYFHSKKIMIDISKKYTGNNIVISKSIRRLKGINAMLCIIHDSKCIPFIKDIIHSNMYKVIYDEISIKFKEISNKLNEKYDGISVHSFTSVTLQSDLIASISPYMGIPSYDNFIHIKNETRAKIFCNILYDNCISNKMLFDSSVQAYICSGINNNYCVNIPKPDKEYNFMSDFITYLDDIDETFSNFKNNFEKNYINTPYHSGEKKLYRINKYINECIEYIKGGYITNPYIINYIQNINSNEDFMQNIDLDDNISNNSTKSGSSFSD